MERPEWREINLRKLFGFVRILRLSYFLVTLFEEMLPCYI